VSYSPEEREQAALFQWAAMNGGQYPELRWLFHVPNGGLRHKAVAMKLKALGVKPGVSDVLLLVPRGGFHGLVIEMKAGKNKETPYQTEFIGFCEEQGYCVGTFWDWLAASKFIASYLDGHVLFTSDYPVGCWDCPKCSYRITNEFKEKALLKNCHCGESFSNFRQIISK
jgi:hypothetical protein